MINKTISISELTRLLYDVREKQPDISVRLRFIGEMWQQNFLRIFTISDEELVLSSESTGMLFRIRDIGTIMQFELDHNFQQFLAYYHYDVGLNAV